MIVKNISGEVQVVFVGNQKIRLGIDESRTFDVATGSTLIREFAGVLIKDDYIIEEEKLLISELVVGEGQEVIQEDVSKKRKTRSKNNGE